MPNVESGKPRARRGFAAMNPDRRREIARKGGASVPGEKRSFAKDRDLAASAGRKGGEASRGGGRTRGSRWARRSAIAKAGWAVAHRRSSFQPAWSARRAKLSKEN